MVYNSRPPHRVSPSQQRRGIRGDSGDRNLQNRHLKTRSTSPGCTKPSLRGLRALDRIPEKVSLFKEKHYGIYCIERDLTAKFPWGLFTCIHACLRDLSSPHIVGPLLKKDKKSKFAQRRNRLYFWMKGILNSEYQQAPDLFLSFNCCCC